MYQKPAYERWYHSKRWERLARIHKAMNPCCVMCAEHGVVMAAEVTDHVIPHRGSEHLFWDMKNWQSLCKAHHDHDKKQLEGKKGFVTDIGADGFPVDPNHPFNRRGNKS